MPLTEIAIRALQPKERPYKVADAGGLHLLVTPAGGRLWRLKFRFDRKEKLLSLGSYPLVSLKVAREKRDDAKRMLAEGRDPSAEKKQLSATNPVINEEVVTFGAVATEYLERTEHEGASQRTMEKYRWLLERLAAPLADRPLREITSVEVLSLLQQVERSGRHETANRLRSAISQVFRLAVVTLRADNDPTSALKGALKAPKVVNRPAITIPKRLGWLMNSIDEYDGWPTLRCALLFTALTAARPGEVRGAEWSEVDLKAARWTIPAQRTKMRRDHDVPLSPQALKVLTTIAELTGRDRLVFSSIRAKERPLSENAMNSALRRVGVRKDEHVAHGFRSSFSTIMNERRQDPEIIELCLAHVDSNKVRSAYNRSLRWNERVAMMKAWADLLDEFRTL